MFYKKKVSGDRLLSKFILGYFLDRYIKTNSASSHDAFHFTLQSDQFAYPQQRWKPYVSRRKTNVRRSDRWGIKWLKSGNVNGRSRKRPQRKFKIFSRKSILYHSSIREMRFLEVELGRRRFITRPTQIRRRHLRISLRKQIQHLPHGSPRNLFGTRRPRSSLLLRYLDSRHFTAL